MADVFISYKRRRRIAAGHLARILEAHGLTVWYDLALRASGPFRKEIETELKSARSTLVLWCALSRDSAWVCDEAEVAKSLGTYLPVFLEDGVKPPLGLGQIQGIDLSRWDGSPRHAAIDSLINAICAMVGRPLALDSDKLKTADREWNLYGRPSMLKAALESDDVESSFSANSVEQPTHSKGDATGQKRERNAISLDDAAMGLKQRTLNEWKIGASSVIDLGWTRPEITIEPRGYLGGDRLRDCFETISWLTGKTRDESRAAYLEWRDSFDGGYYTNDPVAVLENVATSLQSKLVAHVCDYTTIRGLERSGLAKAVGFTGNVLAVADGGATVMIHRRAKTGTAIGPDQYHIFGGWIDPYKDLNSIERCARREFTEEADAECDLSGTPVLLAHELFPQCDFVSTMFLGGQVKSTGRHVNREGSAEPVALGDLPRLFEISDWVDSGRQALLVWLRLGCPVNGRPGAVGEQLARATLNECLEICRYRRLCAD
jgi:8-oxo-dGTP pyrophosphatase MutT (NUDIX family)